ncbi:MAG TPA: DUF2914 domain-containing protein [Burkholderiales bacterium]|jgi:hypothetical protein|nr:DUF2914 domain-containing protein [Burkholderiales bacterium]
MKKLLAAFAMLAMLVPALALAQNLVTDAKLGKNVVDREVTDETTTFAVGEKAYLWLRVEGGTGETLAVVWKINDLEFPVNLSIGGSPWRTWSTKTLHLPGDWTVTVTDAAGNTLNEVTLTVQ